jgi:hypothetical protein
MNKAFNTFLGAVGLIAFPIVYLLLRPAEPTRSPAPWFWFGGTSLALALAAFLPLVVRRLRVLPPHPVQSSDLRYSLGLAAVMMPLTFFAVWVLGPLGSLVILLVPIACILRSPKPGLLKP